VAREEEGGRSGRKRKGKLKQADRESSSACTDLHLLVPSLSKFLIPYRQHPAAGQPPNLKHCPLPALRPPALALTSGPRVGQNATRKLEECGGREGTIGRVAEGPTAGEVVKELV
jgi:hypothetical protein